MGDGWVTLSAHPSPMIFDRHPTALDIPDAYHNRGWCRVEMLYAAHIPVLENNNDKVKRRSMFTAGLQLHCSQGRRPHFVYSSRQMNDNADPRIIPPLHYNFLFEFHPLDGYVSVADDIEQISILVSDILPKIIENHKNGYEGDLNKKQMKHGHGVEHFHDGSIYSGEWQHDQFHGFGSYQYPDGSVYTGKWKKGFRHGTGRLKKSNGDVYFGKWKFNKKNGHGKETTLAGDVFEGEWRDGGKHFGSLRYASGVVYEGHFKKRMKHGKGKIKFQNNIEFEGIWKFDQFVKCRS